MIDSEVYWDRKNDCGENGTIVLSPDDEDPDDLIFEETIYVEEQIHFKKEVFPSLSDSGNFKQNKKGGKCKQNSSGWNKSTVQQIEYLRGRIKGKDNAASYSDFTERIRQKINDGKLNWKSVLNNFIQQEVCDYTFSPPDKRFAESGFFLPDYNDVSDGKRQVIFMVDTSGSINDKALSAVYSEMREALLQFGNSIKGVLCFFDVKVYKPIPFSSISNLTEIIPLGGGGTDFRCVCEFIKNIPDINLKTNIVIFTDGQARIPEKSPTVDVPILWIINNTDVTPPWGDVIHL